MNILKKSFIPQHILAVCWGVLFLGCDDGKLIRSLDPLCYQSCYGGNPIYVNKGICTKGTWECDEDGKLTECRGWVPPELNDLCDGLDNDCDGYIDENNTVVCKTECGIGSKTCARGVWGTCSAPTPSVEICNNKDDNCDGIIDNPELMPVEFCYSGPPGSATQGPCHPGAKACISGQTVCKNEQLPDVETCDGIDNDCDGQIDDGLQDPNKMYDFVFVIDDSCSMMNTIGKIQQASANFAQKYANNNQYRFAVEDITDVDWAKDGKVNVVSNFNDAAVTNSYLQTVSISNGGSMEATWDSVYLTADYINNPLQLNWRAGSSRILILFTDESGQTYSNPMITQLEAAQRAQSVGLIVYVFAIQMYYNDYINITSYSSGQLYDIDQPLNVIENNLNNIIVNSCK